MSDAQDDLLARLVAALDGDDAYELYGPAESTPWGSGRWVRYRDPEGEERYFRVTVEPYRPG